MNGFQLWHDPIYVQTFSIVMGVLIGLSVLFYFLRNRNTHARKPVGPVSSAGPLQRRFFSR
ncbi:MAG: hypothetical protein IPJ84_06580 [Bdellovibrionales bacterium]|nr:hypothetical protein [Bdellovibrionales bacterium]